jgi:iron complex outermembrane receptor protein
VGTDVLNMKKEKVLSISFTGSNLADAAYQNHLSRLKYTPENMATRRQGVFNMGRNFSIKVYVPFNLSKGINNQ